MSSIQRPTGANADEWAAFLETCLSNRPEGSGDGHGYVAVQIAEAIETAELWAVERALANMGWPEIRAYEQEWRNGQGDDDAGGYFLRCLSRLFGVKRPLRAAVDLHRKGMRAMVEQAARKG